MDFDHRGRRIGLLSLGRRTQPTYSAVGTDSTLALASRAARATREATVRRRVVITSTTEQVIERSAAGVWTSRDILSPDAARPEHP
jgi:hypothetical protein